jgi:hypothetical protein
MIRTKGNNGSGKRGKEKGGGLPAQHTPATPNESKTGLAERFPHVNEGFRNNPYFRNPPEHTKFKPGNPGGPGRPRINLTYEMIKQLEEIDEKTGNPKFVEWIKVQIDKSMSKRTPGSGAIAQMIWDRVEGLLKQRVEVAGLIGVVPIPLGDLDGDLKKLSDAELALAERVGLIGLQRARQLEQQREREE